MNADRQGWCMVIPITTENCTGHKGYTIGIYSIPINDDRLTWGGVSWNKAMRGNNVDRGGVLVTSRLA